MIFPPKVRTTPPPGVPSDSAIEPSRPARRVRVLHVEDSATTRMLIARQLEQAGFEVVSAPTGEDGLRSAAEVRPDLVLLDVQLPGIDGFEVCRRLRLRPDTAHIPVLHLSETFVTAADRVRGIENGADWYLTEPIEPVELVATISALTRMRAAEEGARVQADDLATMLATTTDGFWRMDRQGRLLEVNDAYCAMSGRSREELLTMTVAELEHREAPQVLAGRVDEVMATGFDRFESCHRHANGALLEVEVTVSARRETGQLLLFVRDITARKRAKAEILSLNEQLEARVARRTAELQIANRNLETFTFSASHDLRTPLQVLNGFSTALAEDCGHLLDDAGRHYLERIRSASENMAGLLDELLEFCHTDRTELRLEDVDLSVEVTDIVQQLRREQPDRRVRFVIEPGVHATADRRLIRTVLENLLGNAWKFTSARDEATIEFGTVPADEATVGCYVRDDGAGFDPALSDRLFQPFKRLHNRSQFPGTGIGLASVRNAVERHGGRVSAEGAPDHGATFSFILPAARRTSPDLSAPDPSRT